MPNSKQSRKPLGPSLLAVMHSIGFEWKTTRQVRLEVQLDHREVSKKVEYLRRLGHIETRPAGDSAQPKMIESRWLIGCCTKALFPPAPQSSARQQMVESHGEEWITWAKRAKAQLRKREKRVLASGWEKWARLKNRQLSTRPSGQRREPTVQPARTGPMTWGLRAHRMQGSLRSAHRRAEGGWRHWAQCKYKNMYKRAHYT